MKKLKYIALGLSALLLASCAMEEMFDGFGPQEGEEVVITFKPELEDFESVTKALGNGDAVNYVWYAVYRPDGSLVQEFPLQPFTAGKANCPVTIARDQDFKVVFVAQHYTVEGQTKTPVYAVDPVKATLTMPQTAMANSDNYDVFCIVDEVNDFQENTTTKSLSLTRRVAQVNYICTPDDAAEAATRGMTPTASEIRLTGVPASYDIFSGQPSDNTIAVTYAKAALTGEANLLGTAFCFAKDNLTDAELKLYKGDELTTTLNVGNVPVKPNKRTNIKGAIMTGTLNSQIGIDMDDTDISH